MGGVQCGGIIYARHPPGFLWCQQAPPFLGDPEKERQRVQASVKSTNIDGFNFIQCL